MKFYLFLLLVLVPSRSFSQTANQATLTLLDEDGVNEVAIELDVEEIGDSDDTSNLTGTLEVEVNISPSTSSTDEFSIISANVSGSDIELSAVRTIFFNPVAEYDITGTGLGFTAETTNPPAMVDPATGEFDAADHSITVNEGVLDGSANTVLTDEIEVTFNFADQPFTGTGIGTGTITVTPGRREGIRQYYDLVVELPLSINQNIDIEDAPVTASGSVSGTIKAAGETFLEFPTYEIWASGAGVAPDSQDNSDLSFETPNYFLFALGHDEASVPELSLIHI